MVVGVKVKVNTKFSYPITFDEELIVKVLIVPDVKVINCVVLGF